MNLSDLAASGARPLGFTLALALPQVDEAWLAGFSRGLFALADEHDCALIGGDTTRGPLAICITIFGEVPAGAALLRSGAQAGDDIYASGTLGDARLALEVFRGTVRDVPAEVFDLTRDRLELPTPRVALGLALRGVASSAIDVSDGLIGDLTHILQASRVGAVLDLSVAPRLLASEAGLRRVSRPMDRLGDRVLEWVLAGGDDYELAFTAPASARAAVVDAAAAARTGVTMHRPHRSGAGAALHWRRRSGDGRTLPVIRSLQVADSLCANRASTRSTIGPDWPR